MACAQKLHTIMIKQLHTTPMARTQSTWLIFAAIRLASSRKSCTAHNSLVQDGTGRDGTGRDGTGRDGTGQMETHDTVALAYGGHVQESCWRHSSVVLAGKMAGRLTR
eukprot:355623-Chlamydomonas_euryale.AAC.16